MRTRSTLTVRYSFSDRRLFEPFSGSGFAAVPGFGTDVPRRAQNLLGSYVNTFGRFVSEARVGWTRVAAGVFQEGQGTSLNRAVGLPDLSANPRDWGLSASSASPASRRSAMSSTTRSRASPTCGRSPTPSRGRRGRHLFKTGGELRFLGQEAYRDVQSRGYLTFTNQAFTGNALADLLLGLPTVTVGASVDNPQNLRASSYALLPAGHHAGVADGHRLGGRALRVLNTPPVDANDRANLYDPATGAIVPVGEGGCRAPATTPTGTTSRRGWACRGRRGRRPSCARATA